MEIFSYQEAIEARYSTFIKPEFILSNRATIESKFIRLLLGTLTVTNIYSGDVFDQKHNYSILGRPENLRITTKILKECLEPDFKLNDVWGM